MPYERSMEVINEMVGYLVELMDTEEAIRVLRNLGVTDYELVHDLGFDEADLKED